MALTNLKARVATLVLALAALPSSVIAAVSPAASVTTVPDPAKAAITLYLLNPVTAMAKKTDVAYPVKDGYGDSVSIFVDPGVEPPYDGFAVFTIKDSGGKVVLHVNDDDDSQYPSAAYAISWKARDDQGAPLPEGRYRIIAHMHWPDGEVTTTHRYVRVSHAKKTWVTMRRTIRPSDSLIHTHVGRCARLLRPARAAWPASLGYRSRAGCRERRTVVSTEHGIFVPRSPFGHYGTAWVTVIGGRPASARRSYLVLDYLGYTNDWVSTTIFKGRVGRHRGQPVKWGLAVRGGGQGGRFYRPRMIWSVGLADGAAFDVRKFVVRLRFQGLR